MSQTIKFKKMCNGKDIQIVDNKTFMHSINQMKCMPGFQTVKAKYAPDTKAFFDSKTNLEIITKFKNVEFPPSGTAAQGDSASTMPAGEIGKPLQITKNLLQKTISLFHAQASDQIEKERDENENHRPSWITAFNSTSGLTSLKTGTMHQNEATQKSKDLATTLYEPPYKGERCRTKGKFQVSVKTPSDHFIIERKWNDQVNPHYVELVKKRDELERMIFEKKHQQQI